MMRYLAALFFTLLFTHNVLADNLCDASCELTITFPDGGSIDAVDGVTISFADGGVINDGTVTTGYAAGDTLILLVGEKLIFTAGGSITLGSGGNIDYTAMEFNSTGGGSISAVGGSGTITIADLVISGGLNITLDAANIVIMGALNLDSTSVLNVIADTGAITPSVCSISDPAAATLTITGSTPIDTTEACNTISGSISLPVGSLSVGIIDPNSTLTNSGTITLNGGTFTPIVGGIVPLQPVTLTQAFLATLPDGIEFSTEDGNTCTVTAGECVGATGAKYTVVDGKLVLPADGSGLLNLYALAVLFILLMRLRLLGRRLCLIRCRKIRV